MTEYKVQHFVPQWYQRNFTANPDAKENEMSIWVFSIESRKMELNPIYQTAAEDDFYGRITEESLQDLEKKTSTSINSLIKCKYIKGLSPTSVENIRIFLLLQSARTKTAKDITEKAVNRILETEIRPKFRLIYKDSPEKLDYIDALDLSDADFFIWNMRMAIASVVGITDLSGYLLINRTDLPFVSSDHPVVINNYFFKRQTSPGFLTPGLQIFCPISDSLYVLFVHVDLYEFLSKGKNCIEITDKKDVNSLNILQLLNCHRHILSNQNCGDYLNSLLTESDKIRKKNPNYANIEANNFGIKFSFIKINNQANRLIPQYSKMGRSAKARGITRTDGPFRNEELMLETWKQTEGIITQCLEEYQVKQETSL